LTPSQQALWLLARGTSDAGAYNVRAAWRLDGALDTGALARALDALVVRHAALRTNFSSANGEPVQRVRESGSAEFSFVDLARVEASDRERETQRRLHEFGCRVFDLSADTLLRALVLRLDDRSHVMLVVSHHIVVDGSSVGILMRDLSSLYGAYANDREATLPPVPIEFVDFVAWQRERVARDRLEALRTFWQAELSGASATLALPVDRAAGSAPSFAGAHHVVSFSPSLLAALRALARRQNVTLFSILFASYATLLHRYTAQNDIVIGVPVEGRDHPDLESVVGYFASTLPVRARFSGDPTFAETSARTHATILAALEHQDYPSDLLRRELGDAPGDGALATAFMFAPATSAVAKFGTLSAEPLSFETGSSKFDLTLSLGEVPGGLRASFEYRTDLFEPATIARFANHLETLLEAIVAAPHERVSALNILPHAERQRLLVEWNATAAPLQPNATLDALFGEQVARSPDAVAVEDESTSLTYAELDARADAVARRLLERGVRNGELVGIIAERSV
ncbi:MAG: AMP-binding protein, partial [Candidatus Eremiobacteraeota bacterium]|nr:AMP-binding protein [Candidatus Eremiobacteraeota bacterium]